MNENLNKNPARMLVIEDGLFCDNSTESPMPVKVVEKRIGGFSAYFNPERANYLIAKGKATQDLPYIMAHNSNNDVFCVEHERIQVEQKIGEIELIRDRWEILKNLFPILDFHQLLLPTRNVRNQHLYPDYVEDLLALSQSLPDITLAINSWRGGASQNHFHAHIFNREFPALERKGTPLLRADGASIEQFTDYPIVGLAFQGTNGSETALINALISELMQRKIPYNGIFFGGKFYLIPRSNEFDDNSISRGVDSAFGMFPMTTKYQLDTFDTYVADNILTNIGFRSIFLAGMWVTA